MKYSSLVGQKINVRELSYYCLHWPPGNSLGQNRAVGDVYFVYISEHKICDKEGPFFGLECVYEKFGNGNDFIYLVSELEQLGRIPLLTYEIY